MPKPIIALSVCLALASAGCASSEPPTPPSSEPAGVGFNPAMFYDLDGDGDVTIMEFEEAKAGRFNNRDRNDDGSISKEEFEAANAVIRARAQQSGNTLSQSGAFAERDTFARLDSDGNGEVSEAEFMANDGQFVKRADTNNDGVTTKAEIEAFMQRVQRFMGRRG